MKEKAANTVRSIKIIKQVSVNSFSFFICCNY